MADFILTKKQHDATICKEIGEAAGQDAWSIGHRSEGDNVILMMPDGVMTMAQFDAVMAAHRPPDVVSIADKDAKLITDLTAASTVADLRAALIARFSD